MIVLRKRYDKLGKTEETQDQAVSGFKDIFRNKANFIATLKQFLKFGFVGIINTAISLGTYYICVPLGMDKYWANTLGFVISIINAYIWNVKWVFKGNEQGFKATIPKFFTTYIATYLLSLLLLFLFVDLGGMNQYIAPIINTCITMFLNFFISKFWTFKK
ncbi:MAG: GtrA family protein [Christensenellaceae bacterium]